MSNYIRPMRYLLLLPLLAACAGDPCTDDGALTEHARSDVRDHLKAPTTAEFTEETVRVADDGSGMVAEGKVTAKNPMGVPMTHTYFVVTHCDNGTPVTYLASMGDLNWGFLNDSLNAAFQ